MFLVSGSRVGGFLAGIILLFSCSGGSDAPTATGTLPSTQLATVVVTPPPGATGTLKSGQTLQLNADPRDASGNVVNATVAWTSSATGVAIVSITGLVTAVGAGSAIITATATTSSVTKSSTFAVTVTVDPELTTVTVSPAIATIQVGQAVQLNATSTDQNGNSVAATVTWSSSATSIATVSGTGLVSGRTAGTATITAQATFAGKSLSATRLVTVSSAPAVLTSVSVTGGTSVNAGATLQLTATPRDQNGNPIAASVGWTSSDNTKATVSGGGLVTGVAPGSATITATATLGSAVVSSFLAISVNAVFPSTANVGTSGTSFAPSRVDIGAGGQVTWTGLFGHNVIFNSPGSPADIAGPDEATRTFPNAGTFNYACTLHAGMIGSVVVH